MGPASFIHASPAIVEAKRKLAMLERGLGMYLGTIRAVILEDRPFTAIAIERFGCRRRSWIAVNEPVVRNGQHVKVDGVLQYNAVHREDVVPRSGRDREKIAAEFRQGLRLLTVAAQRLGGAEIDELWVQPRPDGTAIIHRASVAPNNTFRMWGPARAVEQVIDTLLEQHDDRLTFDCPEDARDALVRADPGRLHQLEPEELAA